MFPGLALYPYIVQMGPELFESWLHIQISGH